MKTIVANWKMNVGIRESVALARGALLALRGRAHAPDLIVCPPFTALAEVHKAVAHSHAALAAQDMHWEESGAFTGEVSARMLLETGATHVVLGHSERRHGLGETDEMVGKKVAAALAHNLVPIVCVGETADERAAGQTEAVVGRQVRAAFASASLTGKSRIFIAYEPVWAIGSGTPATPHDAAAVHAYLRLAFRDAVKGGHRVTPALLYGGSVDGENAYAFLRETEIDGALVGGASVKLPQLTAIISSAAEAMEGQAAARV